VALLALGSAGRGLDLWPEIDGEPLHGDAFGYYAATRELIASIPRVPAPLLALAVLVLAASIVVAVRDRRRRGHLTAAAVLLPAAGLVLGLTLVILQMESPGAVVMGWPLVWGVAMIPYRALGLEPTPDVAFVFGLVLSLAAVVAATVATAYLGRLATGLRSVGLGAAGLFAFWPLVPRLVAGEDAWQNGQWSVDTGLHLYTEPLSTALVAGGAALLLVRRPGGATLAAAGIALGYATFVKLSNGVIAAALLPLLAVRLGWRRTIPFVLGGAVSVPLVAAYWPRGYVDVYGGDISASDRPWGLDYIDDAWGRSTVFTPVMLVLLAPLFAAGVVALRDRYALAILLVPVVTTVVLYSVYDVTYVHPRFFYVALPFVFVLEAAGARLVLSAVSQTLVKGPFGGGRSSPRGL
jgi:hypothetical protein